MDGSDCIAAIYKYPKEKNLNLFKLNPYSWLTSLDFQFMFSLFLCMFSSHHLSFIPYSSISSTILSPRYSHSISELNTFSVVVRCQNPLMAFLTSRVCTPQKERQIECTMPWLRVCEKYERIWLFLFLVYLCVILNRLDDPPSQFSFKLMPQKKAIAREGVRWWYTQHKNEK